MAAPPSSPLAPPSYRCSHSSVPVAASYAIVATSSPEDTPGLWPVTYTRRPSGLAATASAESSCEAGPLYLATQVSPATGRARAATGDVSVPAIARSTRTPAEVRNSLLIMEALQGAQPAGAYTRRAFGSEGPADPVRSIRGSSMPSRSDRFGRRRDRGAVDRMRGAISGQDRVAPHSPGQVVRARATQEGIVSDPPVHHVVARPSEDHVVASTPRDAVVPAEPEDDVGRGALDLLERGHGPLARSIGVHYAGP